MSHACPMTFENIDSNVSRINSFFVAGFIMLYLVTSFAFILYFVFIDFFIKLFADKKYSPIFILSKLIKKTLHLKDAPIDSGAKRLAAYFGLLFVAMLIVTHHIDNATATYIVAVIFLSCSLLDVVFNYCLGCKIYFLIKKIYPGFMS